MFIFFFSKMLYFKRFWIKKEIIVIFYILFIEAIYIGITLTYFKDVFTFYFYDFITQILFYFIVFILLIYTYQKHQIYK